MVYLRGDSAIKKKFQVAVQNFENNYIINVVDNNFKELRINFKQIEASYNIFITPFFAVHIFDSYGQVVFDDEMFIHKKDFTDIKSKSKIVQIYEKASCFFHALANIESGNILSKIWGETSLYFCQKTDITTMFDKEFDELSQITLLRFDEKPTTEEL